MDNLPQTAPAHPPRPVPAAVVVGVPVRNGARTIGRALDSLLAQAVPVTCLVSQNHSTDDTGAVLAGYLDGDGVVDVSPAAPLTAPENFRHVLDAARERDARWFTWLAADDELLPSYLASAVRRLEESAPDVLFAVAGSEFVSREGVSVSTRWPSRHLESDSTVRRLFAYATQPRWNEIYSVYRGDCLESLGGLEDRYGFDVIAVWRLLLSGRAICLDEIGIRYAVSVPAVTDRAGVIRHRLRRAREGRPPRWSSLWIALFRDAALAPDRRTVWTARGVLVAALVHPRWLVKFAEEIFRRAVRLGRDPFGGTLGQ